MEKLGLWVRLSKVVQDLDCVVHLGDQVYADHDLPARHVVQSIVAVYAEGVYVMKHLLHPCGGKVCASCAKQRQDKSLFDC